MRARTAGLTALLLAYSSSPARCAAEATWLQWRGPDRDGHVAGAPWPDVLRDRLERVWSQPVGPGYSGPLITADLVITFETRDRKEEVARAFDRRTGEPRWQTAWPGSMRVPFFAAENGSWVRGTPASNGDLVLLPGMRDLVVALDVATGRERWRADFMSRHDTPEPAFGQVCSPLLDGEHAFLQAAAGVLKIRLSDGQTVWRSLVDGGGMGGSAFSSPVLAPIRGVRQLVVQTRTDLAGLDPADGRVLWKQPIEAFRGMNILTPVLHGDRIFTSAYGGRSQDWEVQRADDGAWSLREVWSAKQQAYMSSPVVVDGHAYLHLRNQRLVCLRLEDGVTTWTSPAPFAKYASLLRQDKRILALDNRGSLHLLDADPAALRIRDSLSVSPTPDTWAHLAAADDVLVVRAIDQVSLWRWKTGAP